MEQRLEKKRHSGIEGLKLIAIFLVILSHSVPDTLKGAFFETEAYVSAELASDNAQFFILTLFRYCGQLGNCIFVVCSAWYLAEEQRVKTNKVLDIIFTVLLIEWAWFAVYLLSGGEVGYKLVLETLFPITFQHNWFVGCYLLYYLAHPLLNRSVSSASQREFFTVIFISFILYCVISTVRASYYYNNLIGFFAIHYIVAYVRRYVSPAIGEENNNKCNLGLVKTQSKQYIYIYALLSFPCSC